MECLNKIKTHHMCTKMLLLASTAILLMLGSCYYDNEEALYPGVSCDTSNTTFNGTVLPIIQSNCAQSGCHSDPAPSGLILTNYDQIKIAVLSHFLMDHITAQNGKSMMPPSGKLSNCDINKINAWKLRGMPAN